MTAAVATRPARDTEVAAGRTLTLPEARRLYARYPTPWVIAAALVVSATARLAAGGWRWSDLAVAAGILAFEPFTEWLIHVFVLHFRPRVVLGVRVDLVAARKHRAHHADPKHLPLVFVPFRVLLPALVLALPLWTLVLGDVRLGLTAFVTSAAMLLVYEWTHFLVHTSYRPRTRVYRDVWRAHRLHHHRNENYWFGVTVHLADHVLRTFPTKDAVPVSPTARTLGVDDTEGPAT